MTPLHAGKVVLITGAARGIGRATAEEFARQGASVVACDIGAAVEGAQAATAGLGQLQETGVAVRAFGARCLTLVVDVRDQASIDSAVTAALGEFGRLDSVIANAGIMQSGPFWEIDETVWGSVIDINLGGVWRTAKAAVPHMIAQLSGAIVATSSVQGRAARRNLTAYVASKHGLQGLVKNMALELAPYNIRVNSVLPGAVYTPMIDNAATGAVDASIAADDPRTMYFRRMAALRNRSVLPPAAVARAISWLASEGADQITGVELPVDAGNLILPGVNTSPIID